MSDEENQNPSGEETNAVAEAPTSVPVAEGSTNQPEQPAQTSGTDADDSSVSDAASAETPSDAEQVASLEQTPAEDLAVDPSIEQPSQEPTDVVESDDGAEATE